MITSFAIKIPLDLGSGARAYLLGGTIQPTTAPSELLFIFPWDVSVRVIIIGAGAYTRGFIGVRSSDLPDGSVRPIFAVPIAKKEQKL